MGRVATLLICGALLLGAASGASDIVDRVVAVVSSGTSTGQPKVITLSWLTFEARVHIIQISRGRTTIATAPLDLETLRTTLTYVLGQDLIYQQAEQLNRGDVDAKAIEDRHNDFASYLGGPDQVKAFLARYGVEPEHLDEVFKRDLRAEHELGLKLSIESKISEAEIDKYVGEHTVDLAIYADSTDARRAAIAGASLQRDKRLAQAQLRQLYSHAKVRIVDPDYTGADADYQPIDEGSWK